jgi:hypothetical protein
MADRMVHGFMVFSSSRLESLRGKVRSVAILALWLVRTPDPFNSIL